MLLQAGSGHERVSAILSSRVRTSGERIIPDIMTPLALFRCAANGLELQTKVREDFTITEKAPSSTSRAFSWLKAPASVSYLRHYVYVWLS